MFYNFPVIQTIDDVLPYIKDHKSIIMVNKGDYVVIDYVFIDNTTFTRNFPGWEVRRECRGLVFDRNTCKLISRGFHKFFNLGEKEETLPQNLPDVTDAKYYHKLDGSMVRPYKDTSKLMTRMGMTDVSMKADKYVSDNHRDLFKWCYEKEITPIFEFIGPDQRIVVPYKENKLILTAARNNVSGTYGSISELSNYFGVEMVEDIPQKPLDQLVTDMASLKGIEGYVLRWNNGHMVKMKTEEYVGFHRVLNITSRPDLLFQLGLDKRLDDLLSQTEDQEARRIIEETQALVNLKTQEFMNEFEEEWKNTQDLSLKDYGMNHSKSSRYSSLWFDRKKGKEFDTFKMNRLILSSLGY